MYVMTRLLQFRPVFGMVCLALGLCLSQGCARSEPLHRSDTGSAAASEQELPFHPDADQVLASEGTHPAVSPDPKVTSALPFRTGSRARILPSGTLLTVELVYALSTAKVRAGDTFMASVAAPLAIEGDPLIERGGFRLLPVNLERDHRRGQTPCSADLEPVCPGNLAAARRGSGTEGPPFDFPFDISGHAQRLELRGQSAIPRPYHRINGLHSFGPLPSQDLFNAYLFPRYSRN